MSWLFSRALVEGFLEANSSGGERFAPLNVMPTPHPFSHRDKTIDASSLSRFGVTCVVLTAARGEGLLTSFLAGFHARTFHPPEEAQGSMENAAASGGKWHGSLARYDRATSSWRTPQGSLFEGLDVFSETWPQWGTMRNGECWARTTPALRRKERGSGFWPTLTANIGSKCGGRHHGKCDTLASRLAQVEGLNTTSTGRVNPTWSEWLMGFPYGWSAIESLETPKYQQWYASHGIS
jgi:hypothetical protein